MTPCAQAAAKRHSGEEPSLLRGNAVRILTILLILAVTGVVLYRYPMNLGLDLQGGVHIVLEARESPGAAVTDDALERAIAVIDRRVNGLGVAEPVIQRQGERRIVVELPGVSDHQQAVEVIGRTAVLEIQDPMGRTVLTGADLREARLGLDQYGRPAVDVVFTSEGAARLAQLTTLYVGQPIPHLLDGELLVAPVVQGPITSGEAQITGNFTHEEARNLAILLQAGSLPVPLDVVEMRNVGPSLGQESIERSLRAGIAGALLVLLYMAMYYRLPGILADVALGVYVMLMLALLSGLGATLTLPGIAGLILSAGMAVDANVIIFERIRDELRAGKALRAAVRSGFGNAFRAILDANITTLITAGVLFYLGTGPVRGFAVTLGLGVLASMFTAIIVTRWLLAAAVDANPQGAARYFGVGEAA
ncbi:MAG: protein translocase subunit SecD [Firmicutes bacterium]|nr:protein translocase subunit SecD [Bacillota bacterium]